MPNLDNLDNDIRTLLENETGIKEWEQKENSIISKVFATKNSALSAAEKVNPAYFHPDTNDHVHKAIKGGFQIHLCSNSIKSHMDSKIKKKI